MSIACNLRYQADLSRGIEATRMTHLLASGDQGAHTVEVEVLDGGRPVDLTGMSVSGGFLRADDTTVLLTGTVSGNVARVTLPQACYRVRGACSLAIRLTDGAETSTVFWGQGSITRVTSDAVVDTESRIPSLHELLSRIDQLTQATSAATAATASANSAAAQASAAVSSASTAAGAANTARAQADAAAAAAISAAERASDTAKGIAEVTRAAHSAAEAANDATRQVDGVATAAQTAAQQASTAGDSARAAAESAAAAAGQAIAAAQAADGWAHAAATVTMVSADATPDVSLTDTEAGKRLSFRLPRGETGKTPALTVGAVQTGEPGSDARAWLTGSAESPVLNLAIPRGNVGDIGHLTVCGQRADGSGNIRLDAGDVGALPADAAVVRSVNGQAPDAQGNVTVALPTPLDCYPVGSIYMSVNETSPAALFGGKWTRLKDRFLLAASDDAHPAGSTGGAETHQLTLDEIPSHRHHIGSNASGSSPETKQSYIDAVYKGDENTNWGAWSSYAGGGQPHNNMPPYLSVYMWQRVA